MACICSTSYVLQRLFFSLLLNQIGTTGTASTFIVSEGILNSQFSSIFLWLEDENFAMVLCTRQNVFGFIGTVAIYSCPISHDETLRIQNTVQKWERVLLQTKKNIMFNACFCSWLYLFFFFLTPLLYLYQRINQANIEIKIENFFSYSMKLKLYCFGSDTCKFQCFFLTNRWKKNLSLLMA